MKTTFFLLALLLVFNFSTFSQNTGTQLRIIFKLKDDGFKMINTPTGFTGIPQIDYISSKYHILSLQQIALGRKSCKSVFLAEFPSGINPDQVIANYQGVNDIEYAEQDLGTSDGSQLSITPDDPYYIKQWALNNDGSFNLEPAIAGADIDMERAWGINQGDSNIIIAVLSTGNKMDHPELAGRIWTNTDEIPGNGIDDDGNGYVDDVNGWDFVNNDNNPTDDNSAGTCLAGIIGAKGNNHLGDAGINWHANLMIIKALSSTGSGLWLDAANGTYYAVD
ncbi:S8 family serine peptidase, partial [Candidatus Nomurabacteria bacterium]|nr:S8 family serine peptidase [Candidatus Nomurabacteria bacterium]